MNLDLQEVEDRIIPNINNEQQEDITNVQVSLIHKNYFTEDALREMAKNFKQEQKKDQHDVFVGDNAGTNEETLLYYGDFLNFEYRHLSDHANDKHTVDTKFTAGAEFLVKDNLLLRVNGFVTNKNKQIVGCVFPRFRY